MSDEEFDGPEGDFESDVEVDGIGEAIRREIAEQAVEEALYVMYDEVANEGQEVLIDSVEDEYIEQVEDIMEGEFRPVESSHPEAVGQITAKGNEICAKAAMICRIIKAIEAILNLVE